MSLFYFAKDIIPYLFLKDVALSLTIHPQKYCTYLDNSLSKKSFNFVEKIEKNT